MAKKQASAAAGPIRVNNSTTATCTICNNVTDAGGVVVLQPGINENVPAWVKSEQYFIDLRKEKILSVLAAEVEEGDDAPVVDYLLDDDGNKIQATDDKGDPVFDEKTGEPVYVIAE